MSMKTLFYRTYRNRLLLGTLFVSAMMTGCWFDLGDGPYSCDPVESSVVTDLEAPITNFSQTPAAHIATMEGSWSGELKWRDDVISAPYAGTSTPVELKFSVGEVRLIEVEASGGDNPNAAAPEPCTNYLEIDINFEMTSEDGAFLLAESAVAEVTLSPGGQIDRLKLLHAIDWENQAGELDETDIEESFEEMKLTLSFGEFDGEQTSIEGHINVIGDGSNRKLADLSVY